MLNNSEIIRKIEDEVAAVTVGFTSDQLCILDHYGFVAGGLIRSLATGTDIGDVDIFFKNSCAYKYMVSVLVDTGIAHRVVGTKDFSQVVEYTIGGRTVQFIGINPGLPQHIVSRFDFTMNMNFFDLKDSHLEIGHSDDLANRTIRVASRPNHIGVNKLEERARKFQSRGFNMEYDEALRIRAVVDRWKADNMLWSETMNELESMREGDRRHFLDYFGGVGEASLLKAIKPRRAGIVYVDCDCGAKHTSNPNSHSDWCETTRMKRLYPDATVVVE